MTRRVAQAAHQEALVVLAPQAVQDLAAPQAPVELQAAVVAVAQAVHRVAAVQVDQVVARAANHHPAARVQAAAVAHLALRARPDHLVVQAPVDLQAALALVVVQAHRDRLDQVAPQEALVRRGQVAALDRLDHQVPLDLVRVERVALQDPPERAGHLDLAGHPVQARPGPADREAPDQVVLEAVLDQAARLRAAPDQQAVHQVAMDRAVLVHQVDRAHPVDQAAHRVDRAQVHRMAQVAIRDHPILEVVQAAQVAVAVVHVSGLGMVRTGIQSRCRILAIQLYQVDREPFVFALPTNQWVAARLLGRRFTQDAMRAWYDH